MILQTLSSGFTNQNGMPHNPFCDCFECLSPDRLLLQNDNHADDILLDINNALGFGVAAGDTLEILKVVILHDPISAGAGSKALVPPKNFMVRNADDNYIYFQADPVNGVKDGAWIYNDATTYAIIPAIMKAVVNSGNAVQSTASNIATGIKSSVTNVTDSLTNLFGDLKYVIYAILAILVITLIIKLSA